MTHIALRSCKVCRKKLPKTELQRWTITESGLTRDDAQLAPGRGFYSCSERCAEILPLRLKRKK